jgi:predicted metal-dependent hydrolase
MCSEIQLHQHIAIAKKVVRNWTNRDHKKYLETLRGLNIKRFLQGPSARRKKGTVKTKHNSFESTNNPISEMCLKKMNQPLMFYVVVVKISSPGTLLCGVR